MSVCACAVSNVATDTETDTESDTTPVTDGDGEEEVVYEEKIVRENYLPTDVRAYYEDVMSKGDGGGAIKYCLATDSTDHSHHAFQDVTTISNCVIKKISIAVYNTKATDSNGDFVFSLFVHKNSFEGLKSAPVRQYKIKINAAEHGLEDNASTDAKRNKFDLVIKALAEYFGATFVDQQGTYSEITAANMHYHTMDTGCTHLNYKGHAATERMILRYLADKVKNG